MTKMAQAFNTTVAALEDELTQLILEGLINARIDSHSKVTPTRRGSALSCRLRPLTTALCPQILYARDVDQRSTTFEKSLHMGKEFQRRAKAMILRAAVLRNQIHVKVSHLWNTARTELLQHLYSFSVGVRNQAPPCQTVSESEQLAKGIQVCCG